MRDPQAEAYYRLFTGQQRGGSLLPVFRGAPYYQQGGGFGDILKGIFRFLLPVAVRGATTFLDSAARAQESGASIKEAAKAALRPTLSAAASEAYEQFAQRRQQQQQGSGKPKKVKRAKKAKQKRVYKRESDDSEQHSPHSKSIKFNF